jgi:hypothetical protein
MYLLRERRLKRKRPAFYAACPLETLDQNAVGTLTIGTGFT